MTVFFVRHCEAVSNAQEILAGQMEFPLTEKGMQQAEHIAEQFCQKVPAIHYLYASPQQRTQQTAQPFAQRLGLTPILNPDLKEQDWGKFSGKTYTQLRSDPEFHHPREQNWEFRPENGESYYDVHDRLQRFFTYLSQLPADAKILCVTHGGTMRIIRGILEQTAPIYTPHVAANGEVWEIISFNPNKQRHDIQVWQLGLETQHSM